jgi:hypothetical protein
MDTLEKYGGSKKKGVPFMATTDSKGKLIANSLDKDGDNIGMPSSNVDVFMNMLKKAAPKMTQADQKTLRDLVKKKL